MLCSLESMHIFDSMSTFCLTNVFLMCCYHFPYHINVWENIKGDILCKMHFFMAFKDWYVSLMCLQTMKVWEKTILSLFLKLQLTENLCKNKYEVVFFKLFFTFYIYTLICSSRNTNMCPLSKWWKEEQTTEIYWSIRQMLWLYSLSGH